MLVPKELGRGIRRRATKSVECLTAAAQRAKAKVPHFDTRAAGVEDIFCLQVPVDDVVFMLWENKEKLFMRAVPPIFRLIHSLKMIQTVKNWT